MRNIAPATDRALINKVINAVALRGANNPKLRYRTVNQKTTTTRNGVEIDLPLYANRSHRVCPRLIANEAACA